MLANSQNRRKGGYSILRVMSSLLGYQRKDLACCCLADKLKSFIKECYGDFGGRRTKSFVYVQLQPRQHREAPRPFAASYTEQRASIGAPL